MSERTLAQGQEAKIDVTVDTKGRRGRLGKTVRVYSNDPSTPVTMLMIEAQIDAPEGPAGPPTGAAAKQH